MAAALEGCLLRLAAGATERGLAVALVLLEFNFFAPEGALKRVGFFWEVSFFASRCGARKQSRSSAVGQPEEASPPRVRLRS